MDSNQYLPHTLAIHLEYCNRIYLRQLSEEDKGGNDLLKRFHNLLRTYFRENRQLSHGLPTVSYCASELAYSSRYFGDLIHKATGGTAIGYIHNYVINQAKSLLMNGHNINETSRLLGFDFPHHFTRLFKRITGLTPSEFLGKYHLQILPKSSTCHIGGLRMVVWIEYQRLSQGHCSFG